MIASMPTVTILHHGGPLDGKFVRIDIDNDPPARINYPLNDNVPFPGWSDEKVPVATYEVYGVEPGEAPLRGHVASARFLGKSEALPGLVHYA